MNEAYHAIEGTGQLALHVRQPHHFEFVDALRGFAILAVVMIHTGQQIPAAGFGKFRSFTDAGENGVMLFFVVSAFTLFWSLQNRMLVDRQPLKAFFVRRFFRIAPLFWIGMAFYLAFPDKYRSDFAPNGIGWPQILTTFFFVHGWYPTTINSIVPGGWSIAAEVMFYLCIPLLFKKIKTLCGALWLTLLATCVARLVTLFGTHVLTHHFPDAWTDLIGDFQYWILPSQLPVFCMGMVLYFVLTRQMARSHADPTSKAEWSFCLLSIALLLMLRQTPDQVIFAGAFVLIAWGLAIHPVRIFVNSITRFIGQISYSIYIWHFYILQHLPPYVLPMVHQFHKAQLNGIAQFCVLYVAGLLLSIAVAVCSYHIIELPTQRLGKRVIGYMNWGA